MSTSSADHALLLNTDVLLKLLLLPLLMDARLYCQTITDEKFQIRLVSRLSLENKAFY